MLRIDRWSAVMLAMATQLACSKSHDTAENNPPPAAEKPKSPPAGSLPSAIVFTATGDVDLDFARCHILATGLQLDVTCDMREAYDYPFTLEVPGSQPSAKTPAPRSQSRDMSLVPAFGRAASNTYKSGKSEPDIELDPASDLTIVFQNGTRLSGKLPVIKLTGMDYTKLSEQLAAMSKKPFQFSKDEPAVTKHSVLHIWKYHVDVIGPAAHYNETDWTAVEEGVERETTKICKGYTVDGASEPKDLPLTAEDVTVTVRNRATGEVLQTKTFPSDMGCPPMAAGRLVAGPDYKAIPSWLASLITKK